MHAYTKIAPRLTVLQYARSQYVVEKTAVYDAILFILITVFAERRVSAWVRVLLSARTPET